jgi:hypothetical protein
MIQNNIFIQKRILPEISKMYIESFLIRELSEVNSLVEFIEFLEGMKEWAKEPAHHFTQEDRFSREINIDEIPLFMVEMSLVNEDQRKLNVRILTNLSLSEFIRSIDMRIMDLGLLEIMELKGVPLCSPS